MPTFLFLSLADLLPGDAITAVNDVRVISVSQAVKQIKASENVVRLTILREGGADVNDEGSDLGDVLRTRMLDGLSNLSWANDFEFDVPADKRFLYIHVYSCKVFK